jgi:hypothetical protein
VPGQSRGDVSSERRWKRSGSKDFKRISASAPHRVICAGVGYRLPEEPIYRIFATWSQPMWASMPMMFNLHE